ncbi:MAG: TRAP transporter substrate-binding protein DctP [Deltaproteobacteria bacterium]|nr:TRAP transporter substrate-binding protein DctP [Deltaproteobacteria bacterium]
MKNGIRQSVYCAFLFWQFLTVNHLLVGGVYMKFKKFVDSTWLIGLAITVLSAAVLFFSAGTVKAADKQKVIKWRMQDIWGPEVFYHKANLKLAARIKEMSNGRLDIQMFPTNSLISARNSFDAIRKGVFQGHISCPAYWAGKMPASAILFSVPGGIDSVLDFNTWFWERGGIGLAREAYKKFGLYCVGPGIAEESYQFIKERHPVRSLADYKGLKIRTLPGLQSQLMEALGANPVFIPQSEVYTAVETGVLDGVSGYSTVGWYQFGIHEITKYCITPGFIVPVMNLDVVVNMKAWNKLPPDLQAIFECAVREWNQYWYSGAHLQNRNALNQMVKHGIEILRHSDEDLQKIRETALPIVDKWAAKDPLAKKVWESQKDYLRFLGKIK